MTLAPTLLLSMPQLVDPNFSRSVVLLCKHSANGAFGLVVNRPLVTSGRVVVNLGVAGESASHETISTERELQVWIGGPVEPQRSWMLVSGEAREGVGADFDEDGLTGMRIASGLYLTTSPDLLRRMLEPKPPSNARFVIGYSGWGPGQLEAELEASAWLISDVDKDLIFTTPPERMWETAIRRLGADPAALQTSRGVH
jgi:putative transcriptional regulator